MAHDRADPLRDADAEEHIMGIINDDIPYVPAEEDDQQEDISSYLNLDGEGEGHRQSDDEGTDIVDGGQPSTNDDLELQVATTSSEVYIH